MNTLLLVSMTIIEFILIVVMSNNLSQKLDSIIYKIEKVLDNQRNIENKVNSLYAFMMKVKEKNETLKSSAIEPVSELLHK